MPKKVASKEPKPSLPAKPFKKRQWYHTPRDAYYYIVSGKKKYYQGKRMDKWLAKLEHPIKEVDNKGKPIKDYPDVKTLGVKGAPKKMIAPKVRKPIPIPANAPPRKRLIPSRPAPPTPLTKQQKETIEKEVIEEIEEGIDEKKEYTEQEIILMNIDNYEEINKDDVEYLDDPINKAIYMFITKSLRQFIKKHGHEYQDKTLIYIEDFMNKLEEGDYNKFAKISEINYMGTSLDKNDIESFFVIADMYEGNYNDIQKVANLSKEEKREIEKYDEEKKRLDERIKASEPPKGMTDAYERMHYRWVYNGRKGDPGRVIMEKWVEKGLEPKEQLLKYKKK